MRILCIFGFHKWNGCKCSKCGNVRDEGHDWSMDCEKCARCGKTRQEAHSWDGCKCGKCGATRDEGHDWSMDCEKCARCGKTQQKAHSWDGCKCGICGATRDEGHDWSKDCEKCIKCGKTRTRQHNWDGHICRICKKILYEDKELYEMSVQQLEALCSSDQDWISRIRQSTTITKPEDFIFFALINTTPEQFEVFLKHGAPANARSRYFGRGELSLLHMCANKPPINGRPEHARALLRYGAHVNALDMAGDSPLYVAALNGLVDVARVLLEGGATTSVPGSKANVFKYARGAVLEVIEKYKRK